MIFALAVEVKERTVKLDEPVVGFIKIFNRSKVVYKILNCRRLLLIFAKIRALDEVKCQSKFLVKVL